MLRNSLFVGLATVAVACAPDIEIDDDETSPSPIDGPTVEFDPSAQIIPFPNNLLLDPMTGKVNLPEQCNESPTQLALRIGVLNTLDGFGTFKPVLRATFTEPIDAASLEGNIKVFRRATGMTAVVPGGATEVPLALVPGTTTRFSADCSSSEEIVAVNIIPLVPLTGSSTYTVVIQAGVKTTDGADYIPSVTWALTRQSANPVQVEDGVVVDENTPFDPTDETDENANSVPDDIETLLGIDLLWKAHAQAVAFIEGTGTARNDQLLTWDFNTQTTTAPLDPTVSDSLANMLSSTGFTNMQTIAPDGTANFPTNTALNFMGFALFGITGVNPCGASLPCSEVGEIILASMATPKYQSDTTNPFAGGAPVPGAWSDPVAPTQNGTETQEVAVFLPASPAPAQGYPVIIFAHGLGASARASFLVASQLAAAGYATVAIDAVAHGTRAVQVSEQGPCAADPNTRDNPECFAPPLSTDLAATRDNFRQTSLDHLYLIETLKSCTSGNCGNLDVDPNRIGYLSHSLGALHGAMTVSVSSDIKVAVLNAPGAGLMDLIESTPNPLIACPLVDGLIAEGVLTGDPSSAGASALCLTDTWTDQPAYRSFSVIAKWILDPSDAANYTAGLAGRPVLLQQMLSDEFFPAIIAEQLGGLLGLSAAPADVAVPAQAVPPSDALFIGPTVGKWLTYADITETNAFSHFSLIIPPQPADTAGQLGTVRLQIDARTFLDIHL